MKVTSNLWLSDNECIVDGKRSTLDEVLSSSTLPKSICVAPEIEEKVTDKMLQNKIQGKETTNIEVLKIILKK